MVGLHLFTTGCEVNGFSSKFGLIILQVPASINCRLLEHQREGVKFLYRLYENNHGGILGDDM